MSNCIKSIDTRWLALPLGLVMAQILLLILLHPGYVCFDSAINLQYSQLVLESKVPYVDFIDTNFPTAFYQFVCPAWVAAQCHLGLPLAVNIFTWLLTVCSLLCSYLVIHNRISNDDVPLLGAILFGFTILNLPLFFHYAQKEHILILLFMPFFFMRWLRRQDVCFGLWLPFLAGSAAAVGICIKPPIYLILATTIESYWLTIGKRVRARLLDPEMRACITTILLVLIWFVSWTPMRNAFLERWVPFMISGVGAYCCSLHKLLFLGQYLGSMTTVVTMILICIIALLIHRHHGLIVPLLIWTMSGYLMYAIQGRGSTTHTIVMVAGCFMLANLELALAAKWIGNTHVAAIIYFKKAWGSYITQFAIYSFMLCCLLPWLIRNSFTTGKTVEEFQSFLHTWLHAGDSVFIVSDHVYPAYPCLVQLDARPASRYAWTFPLTMYKYLLKHTASSKQRVIYEQGKHRIIQEIYDDLRESHPVIIAVASEGMSNLSDLYTNGLNRLLANYCPLGYWNGGLVWIQKRTNRNQLAVVTTSRL